MGVFDWGYRQKAPLEPAMPLTDTAIKKAKPGAKPVKLSDGRGLYLLVSPAGSKLWRWKYRFLGKEKVMALGAYPDVSLAQAREGGQGPQSAGRRQRPHGRQEGRQGGKPGRR
jgi:hypothetical protein